jgi:hypothetical protein
VCEASITKLPNTVGKRVEEEEEGLKKYNRG